MYDTNIERENTDKGRKSSETESEDLETEMEEEDFIETKPAEFKFLLQFPNPRPKIKEIKHDEAFFKISDSIGPIGIRAGQDVYL